MTCVSVGVQGVGGGGGTHGWLNDYPLLRTAYRVIDRESYLDWGLSSDYDLR